MNQFDNIDSIVNYLESVAEVKFDTTVPVDELVAVAMDGNVGLQVDSRRPIEKLYGGDAPDALPMERGMFRSMMYRLKLANLWKGMRDDISPNFPEEAAALLNAIFAHEKFNSNKRGMKQAFVRSRGEYNGIQAAHRGFFSERYTAFDMVHTAKVVQQQIHAFAEMPNTNELMATMKEQYGADVSIVDNGDGNGIGHKIERANIGIDAMSFRFRYNMEFKTETGRGFYVGAFIRTDEIGGSSIHFLPYVWDRVCANGMVISYERSELKMMRDANGWSPIFPHMWGSVDDLTYKATQAVAFASGYGAQLVEKSRQAAYRSIPNANEILGRMLQSVVPKDKLQQATLIAGNGMEGEATVMGIINGVTAAAHSESLDQDTIDSVEAIGGTALRKFNNEMSDSEITNLFLHLAKVDLIESELDI